MDVRLVSVGFVDPPVKLTLLVKIRSNIDKRATLFWMFDINFNYVPLKISKKETFF